MLAGTLASADMIGKLSMPKTYADTLEKNMQPSLIRY
jgi:hypothetical protein